jgi:uncharacterized membrane protein
VTVLRALARRPPLGSDIVRSNIALLVIVLLYAPVSSALAAGAGDIIGPDLLIATYLVLWTLMSIVLTALTLVAFAGADGRRFRVLLRLTNPPTNRLLRLVWAFFGGGATYWATAGAAVALAGLVYIALRGTSGSPLLLLGGVLVVAGSFAVIVVSYAVAYAREFSSRRGLAYPGTPNPRFVDFVYLAAQVSTTFGGSDVEVRASRMRTLITGHSILAFTFNTVIVALMVSVLLGVVS